jgi:hypothetical protein
MNRRLRYRKEMKEQRFETCTKPICGLAPPVIVSVR